MIKPEDMIKIQGLFKMKIWARYKGKRLHRGPYWFGWWMDNGKQERRYIGKNLPPQLEFLLKGRVKLPGRKLWSWPAHKMVNKAGT